MIRVTYLVSHPIQYQAPLFRAVAAGRRIDLTVAFGCKWGVAPTYDPNFGVVADFGVDLLSGYNHRFLDHPVPKTLEFDFWALKARDIDKLLGPTNPDVLVVHGWATALMWQGVWWARKRGIPVLVRGENPAFAAHPEPQPLKRRLARAVLRRVFFSRVAGVLVLGRANARFYERINVEWVRRHALPYFVDNDAVRHAADRGRARRTALRRELGIPADATLIVALGKLMAKKRPQDIASLLALLPLGVHGLWIGSGASEEPVKAEAERLGVAGRLHFGGFRPPAQAWELLGASDLFFFPAEREKWGLVLNEAVAAGLPVIASDYVGAAEDIVEEGVTGDVFPCGNTASAARKVQEWLLRLPLQPGGAERTAMLRIANEHSLERCADLFAAAAMAIAAVRNRISR